MQTPSRTVRAYATFDNSAHTLTPRALLLRSIVFLAIMFALASVLAGCAVRDHADGGGYTVRYASAQYLDDDPPPPPPRRVVRRIRVVEAAPPPVVIVREHRESHPVLNLGKDDEIPRDFARYVSDRSVRSWRQRSKMCRQARPGYCSVPNVAHCHGAFCHAHPGGNRRHTH